MEIRVRRRLTGSQLRDAAMARYGDRETLEGRAEGGDIEAQDALWNLRLLDEDPARLEHEMTVEDLVVLEHNDLSKLTATRLHLLEVLRGLGEANLLELTQAVKRDVKNVSQDVGFLEAYGLVESYRRGKDKRLAAAGNEIVVSV